MRRLIITAGLLGATIAILLPTTGASRARAATDNPSEVVRQAWQMQTIYLPNVCRQSDKADPDDGQLGSERSDCPPK